MGEISFFDYMKKAPAGTGATSEKQMLTDKTILTHKVGTWQEKVKQYLENDETLRGSDRKLYFVICADIAGTTKLTLAQAMFEPDRFPDYETIRRARQKIQESCPRLKPKKEIQEKRKELEADFESYALGI